MVSALGEEWSVCDNTGACRERLIAVFKSDTRVQVEQMMSDEERAARDALPATVTAWRGCYEHNKRGLSYSLKRDIAAKFPFLARFRDMGLPVLVTVRMLRSRAVLKLDREEQELIVINPRIINVELLPRQLQ